MTKKLSATQIYEILASADSNAELARRFNISASNISLIRTGKRWQKLTATRLQEEVAALYSAD